VGTLVSTAASRPREAVKQAPEPPSEGSDQEAPTPSSPRDSEPTRHLRELARLDARLRSLEDRAVQPSDTQNAKPVEDVPLANVEDRKRDFWLSFHKLVDDHRRAPVDPAWADRNTTKLKDDLLKTGLGFQVGELSCKTTTCLARLTWPSRGQAAKEYADVVHAPLRVNCVRTVIVDEESASNGETGGTVFLDCANWKALGEPEATPTAPRPPPEPSP